MSKETALAVIPEIDKEESVVEYGKKAEDVFVLPNRNWNRLIEEYNRNNKRKFPLTPLECRRVIEYAKKGIPVKYPLEAMGHSNTRYNNWVSQSQEAEEKLEELSNKEFLLEEELNLFHKLLRHPMRILISDINRADGISKVMDWERFNKNTEDIPDAQFAKMKARYKDYFSEREVQNNGYNVQIILGGDLISNL